LDLIFIQVGLITPDLENIDWNATMKKIHVFATYIANIVFILSGAIIGGFLLEILLKEYPLSPLLDFRYNLIQIGIIGGIILLFLLSSIPVLRRQRPVEKKPDHPAGLGWSEAASVIALTICMSFWGCLELESALNNRPPPPRVPWLAAVVFLGGSCFLVEWPTERKQKYDEMEQWIIEELLDKRAVKEEDIIKKFAPRSWYAKLTKKVTKEEYQYKLLINSFKEKYKLIIDYRNGQFLSRFTPTEGDSSQQRKPP
jgi:hypothetical protein